MRPVRSLGAYSKMRYASPGPLLPGAGGAALLLVRSVSDPLVTDLSYFRPSMEFEALPRGSFTFVRTLASGISGEICHYRWRRGSSEECVAVKKLNKDALQQLQDTETDERAAHLGTGRKAPEAEDSLGEIGILAYLSKQPDLPGCFLRMLGAFSGERAVWLVSVLADGGDLFDVAASGRVPAEKVQRYVRQVLMAVAYLHQHHIGHRDVSLENVLLKGGTARLVDFGMAVRSHSASGAPLRFFRAVGKDCYRAPEVYVPPNATFRVPAPPAAAPRDVVMVKAGSGYLCEVRLPPGAAPGRVCTADTWGYAAQPVDVFSTGVCLFALAWQCPPWQRAMLSDAMFAFVHGRGDTGLADLLRHWKKPLLRPEAMRLLTEMLRPDPAQRPSAAACLASPWLAAAAGAQQLRPAELA
mmetsp:Transcript_91095/g.283166  ORF Transcript_91095/g.283166 Transcript_91095/m.283166 type:complete len:413 (-) Transcript_91095:48-1286(-)